MVLNAMEGVFHRMEETVEPVSREDVSELLRRRLFESVAGPDTRRAMGKLPLRDSQKDQQAYDRLNKSYPFHPDLLEVFYQKWTQLSEFQRTRGVLRTFAITLKASDRKDSSPFVGPESLLGTDDELSDAVRELIEACEEGNLWTPILSGELEKARDIQKRFPRLKCREIEGAVIATFLHSQPLGQKADATDLYVLLAHPDVDKMSVEEGLSEWRKVSWFLKEDESIWCLGTTPNLTNMHVRAMERLNEDQINDDLVKRIKDAKLGQNADDVVVHTLPNSPADISDNPNLHFVIVGPEYAAVPGRSVPSSLEAFFTYRNNVIVLAPENSRLAGLRYRIRKILGWQGIESGDEVSLLSEPQKAVLIQRKRDDETSKPVQRLYGMFASLPRLPRLLGRKVFVETLRRGVMEGRIVLRTVRPDGSQHTFWRESPSDEDLSKRDLEIVPIEHAELHNLSPDLLLPSRLPELWQSEDVPVTVGVIREFFVRDDVPKLAKNEILFDAIRSTVQSGLMMALSPCKAYLKEVIPDAEICDDLELLAPLQPISGSELNPNTLSEAWEGETSSVGKVMLSLAKHKSTPIPWSLVVDAINDGLSINLFEIIDGSPAWPCTADKADQIGLQVSRAPVTIVPADLIGDDVIPMWESGQPTRGLIKETLESKKGVSIRDNMFLNAAKGTINSGLIISDDPLTNDLYVPH